MSESKTKEIKLKYTGGSAFPSEKDGVWFKGMSLRQFYAGCSLAGQRANGKIYFATPAEVSERAREDADAMLAGEDDWKVVEDE